MSTRFEAANSESAGKSGITVPAAWTFGGYFYLHSLPASGAYAPIITVYGAFSGFSVMVDSAGKLRIYDYTGSVISGAGTATLATGTWYYLWIELPVTGGGNSISCYLNASGTADLGAAGSSFGPARIEFATNQSSFATSYWADISLDAWKGWSIDRAASNAATEDDAHALASSSSAIGAWYFDGTDVSDHNGNVNDLTATGTLSAGPDSPIDGAPAPAAVAPLLSQAMRPTAKRVIGRAALAMRTVRPPQAGVTNATFSDSVTESAAAADTETATADFVGARTEALTAADSSTGAMTAVVAAAETLAAADTQTAALSAVSAAADSLSVADSATGAFVAVVARAESLTATDTQDANVIGAGEQTVESLTATATQTATVTFAASRTEALTAADSETGTLSAVAAVIEALTATDSQLITWITSATRAEALSVTDVQDAFVGEPMSVEAGDLTLVSDNGRLALMPDNGRLLLIPDRGALAPSPDL